MNQMQSQLKNQSLEWSLNNIVSYMETLPSQPQVHEPLPDEKAVRSLVGSAVPDFKLKEIKLLSSARVLKQYQAESADGSDVMVNISPPFFRGLIRSERDCVRSEAALLSWLTLKDSPSPSASPKSLPNTPWCPVNQPLLEDDASQTDIPSTWKGSYYESLARSLENPEQFKEVERFNMEGKSHRICGSHSLTSYLPQLIEHGILDQLEQEYIEYNVLIPTRGTPIALLDPPLTPQERISVNQQLGQMVRRISSLVSPTKQFGVPTQVLNFPCTKQVVQREPTLRLLRNVGSLLWPDAFRKLLEDVLADVEDSQISLAYGRIRQNMERFKHILGAVKEPRLVALDATDDRNVCVTRQSRPCPEDADEKKPGESLTGGSIEVTGLKDWSMCVFGDPLFATMFGKGPSCEFWRGFEESLPKDTLGQHSTLTSIEDKPHSHVRVLLYEMYHGLSMIAQGYRRREAKDDTKAMEGRRRLAAALGALDKLDDCGQPNHDNPEAEIPKAKRTKKSEP